MKAVFSDKVFGTRLFSIEYRPDARSDVQDFYDEMFAEAAERNLDVEFEGEVDA